MNPYKTSAKTAKGRTAMQKVGKNIGQLSTDKPQEPDSVTVNKASNVEALKK